MDELVIGKSISKKSENWSDVFRIPPDESLASNVRECEVKPCRQIVLLRYPAKR